MIPAQDCAKLGAHSRTAIVLGYIPFSELPAFPRRQVKYCSGHLTLQPKIPHSKGVSSPPSSSHPSSHCSNKVKPYPDDLQNLPATQIQTFLHSNTTTPESISFPRSTVVI